MQQSARTYATLKSDMAELIDLSRIVLYPEVFSLNPDEFREQASIYRMRALLMDILSSIYGGGAECEKAADGLFAKLGEIRATLETDIQAAYEGDPAAKSREEMLMVNKEAQQNRTRTVSPAAIPSKANYRVKSKKHL